jgi:phage terminase large subunit-like protein
MNSLQLNSLSSSTKREAIAILEELARRKKRRKLFTVYPDEGPLRRELYAKHLQFFAAGIDHHERAAVAANRVGKSFGLGGYETTLHLTGLYPDWWPGRRFAHAIDCWAAGDTSETTRDIPQLILLGPAGEYGTGLIPGDRIAGKPTHRAGVAEAVDTVRVKHVSGGVSRLGFKSYDQGRKKFQGTAKHLIWMDEEPPEDVYSECMARLMTTSGSMLCTFTPLEGLSNVVLRYMPHMAPAAAPSVRQ